MTRKFNDKVAAIIAFVFVIIMNWLANALPIGGQTTAEVSAKYPSLFTPAGFTFSIWGVIYLGLLIYVVYQALPGQKENETLSKINWLFIINCVANGTWILAWQYDYLVISLLIMIVILVSLIRIYRKISVSNSYSPSFKYFVSVPFSIYLGWITVATIANISVIQTAFGLDNLGLEASEWTLLKLSIAGAIGAIMALRFSDIPFIIVIAWASFGIASKQIETPLVAGGARTLLGISLLLASFQVFKKYQNSNSHIRD